MRKYLILILLLLTLSPMLGEIWAKDVNGQFLPVGAKKRLGKGWARDIEFSPDGSQFAVATTIGIWIYDRNTGNLVHRIEGIMGGVNDIAYSRDGNSLAAAHDDHTIRIWDPNVTNQADALRVFRGHTRRIHAIMYSPDGRILASAGEDNSILLWNPDGENDREKHIAILPYRSRVRSIDFSIDGHLLVGGSDDGIIQVWDTGTGDNVCRFKAHKESVIAVDFSPIRNKLSSTGQENVTKEWHLMGDEATLISTLPHKSELIAVKYSPDGNTLATGTTDRIITLWKKNAAENSRRFEGHRDLVSTIDFSRDGNAIVSGSLDGRILLWEIIGARFRYEIPGHTGGIKSLTFTDDNRILACGTGLDDRLRIWDAGTGSTMSILREHTGLTQSVTFSNDGKKITSGGKRDDTIFLSDVTKVLSSSAGFSDESLLSILAGNTHGITALAFAPEDSILATGGMDGRIHLISLSSKRSLDVLRGPQSKITALTFVDDGNHLISGEENGTIRQWNGLTGEEIGDGIHASLGSITALSYSTKNRYLGVADNIGRIQFFNTDKEKRNTIDFQTPHRSKVTDLVFSMDGNTLVSGSENGTIILWDMREVIQSPEVALSVLQSDKLNEKNRNSFGHQKNELSAQAIARKARKSTVYLRTLNVNGDAIGAGSGFFIDTGLIATNFHVIDGSSSIFARVVDKEKWYYVEKIAAIDKSHDLVILKVSGIDTPVLSLANSDTIEIGENVYAMGNPQGWEGTFSEGIISSIRGENQKKWIQITAPVSPGSSGGAILNRAGEVIGIATLAYFSIDPKSKVNRSQNINFAVPSNFLKELLKQVKQPVKE